VATRVVVERLYRSAHRSKDKTELDDLVALMASLTSEAYRTQGEQELARQRALSRTNRPYRDTRRAFGRRPATSD